MDLHGKTILITRAANQSAELKNRLEAVGARVIECPTIQIVDPEDWTAVDDAIRRLDSYDWILFTSANAVERFVGRPGFVPAECRNGIAAVGSATAAKLQESGLRPTLVPQNFRAEGLLAAFPAELGGVRILFPRAETAREVLPDELRRRGAVVDIVAVYRTVKSAADRLAAVIQEMHIDCAVFTSPSTIPEIPFPPNIKVAVIGPITRDAAEAAGTQVSIMPERSTIPALVEAIRLKLAALLPGS